MKFRKKPVIIEAEQFLGTDKSALKIMQWTGNSDTPASWDGSILRIYTLEGTHIVSPWDWVIKGFAGEFYPCKPTIFEATYERVYDV